MSPPLTLLLVEDSLPAARLLQILLEEPASEARFRVDVARTLRAALTSLAAGPYDVVLTDLSLPDSAGLSTFRAIKAAAGAAAVIVLTGLDADLLAERILRDGAADYVEKGSLGTQPLIARVLAALASHRQRAQEAAPDV